MRVGGLDAYPDCVALLRGLLENGHEVRIEDDVPHVVDGHVAIDAVLGELVGHDAAAGVVDEDVDAVGSLGDLVGDFFDFGPVAHVALEPGDFLSNLGAHLFRDDFFVVVDDFLREGENVDVLDVLAEHGVDAAPADTF